MLAGIWDPLGQASSYEQLCSVRVINLVMRIFIGPARADALERDFDATSPRSHHALTACKNSITRTGG